MTSPIPRVPESEYMDLPHEAKAYAEADFSDVNTAFVDHLLELTGPLEKGLVLDLGTGPADIPIRVSTRRPGWTILAVDASLAMLRLACGVLPEVCAEGRLLLVQADAKRLPVPPGRFDVVFSNSILHHIDDTASLWREIMRAAAPGALVFLRDLTRPSSAEEAYLLVEKHAEGESALLKEEFRRSLLAAYTPAEVEEQLLEAGLDSFTVLQVTDRHLDIVGRVPS